MTDPKTPKISVAFHFLGIEKPGIFHGDRVDAPPGGFRSGWMGGPGPTAGSIPATS